MTERNLSVAMATYNGEKYLSDQIDSIINQTCRPEEIIVSDDHSTDGTISILENYQNRGLIKYFINPKKGVIENFKNAVRHCKRDNFIALSDQDDIWFPEKNELCLYELMRTDPQVPTLVFSDLAVIDSNNRQLNKSFFKEIVGANPEFEKLKSLLYSNKVIGCSTVFNQAMRNYFEKMPNDILMHDYWIALISFTFGKHVYIKKPLINYRRHSNNVTSTHDSLVYKFLKELIDYMLNREIILDKHIETVIMFNQLYNSKFDSNEKKCIDDFINLKYQPTYKKRLNTFKYKSSKEGNN
jgi:glycosyltransferase involved in cell wall biosynthesis